MKMIAHQIARREIEAHRKTVNGITAEQPRYAVVDKAGNKEWVVDVYLNPDGKEEPSIARNVPIAPIAHELITDVRMPVEMQRSKQGKLTIVGRGKVVPAGAQMPDGSPLDPSYHEIKPNLAQLGLLWTQDLDYQVEKWGEKPWGAPGKPWRSITITDAFGNIVSGPDVDPEDVPRLLSLTPSTTVKTKHVKIARIPWGTQPWGTFLWGGHTQTVIELEE